MKTEAHRIALECYAQNNPINWPWIQHLKKSMTMGERFAWAITNCEAYAPLGTTQDTLIEAAKHFLTLLYK